MRVLVVAASMEGQLRAPISEVVSPVTSVRSALHNGRRSR